MVVHAIPEHLADVREQIENKGPTSSTYPSSLTKTDERNDIWQPRAIVPGRACE